MTGGFDVKRLHWTQRIALIRHNLHAASRTLDFTFFKTIQAQTFLEGTDYVALLTSMLEDDADSVLHGLDDLNAGMAYVHQDAFKACYNSIRASIGEEADSRRGKLSVDVSQQKQSADFGIDKMANAAIALIENQPAHCQEAVANVWLIGATIIADAVQLCIGQMNALNGMMDDFILLEYSWQMVQTAVESSVSALRGVFNLMATSEPGSSMLSSTSERSMNSPYETGHGRSASFSSSTTSLFKRLSAVLVSPTQSPTAPPVSARSSISHASPRSLRNSISYSNPMNMPHSTHSTAQTHCAKAADAPHLQRKLSTIPPTPFDVNVDPFDTSFNREANLPYTVLHTLEDYSPLDMDPMESSSVVTPTGLGGEKYTTPTFFSRSSQESRPTGIAI